MSQRSLTQKLDENLHELALAGRLEVEAQSRVQEICVGNVGVDLDQTAPKLPPNSTLCSDAHRLPQTYQQAVIADVFAGAGNLP